MKLTVMLVTQNKRLLSLKRSLCILHMSVGLYAYFEHLSYMLLVKMSVLHGSRRLSATRALLHTEIIPCKLKGVCCRGRNDLAHFSLSMQRLG